MDATELKLGEDICVSFLCVPEQCAEPVSSTAEITGTNVLVVIQVQIAEPLGPEEVGVKNKGLEFCSHNSSSISCIAFLEPEMLQKFMIF